MYNSAISLNHVSFWCVIQNRLRPKKNPCFDSRFPIAVKVLAEQWRYTKLPVNFKKEKKMLHKVDPKKWKAKKTRIFCVFEGFDI